MVGDATPPYPQFFLTGFRRFTKMTFVKPASSLVVSLGKALNRIVPTLEWLDWFKQVAC